MSSHQDLSPAKFYTYAHFRLDDGKCLYIGKGKSRRAWSKAGRSDWWKRTVAKHGYRVQILATWESEEDAFQHEKLLIACFRDMGHPLVNLTDGGEGMSGCRHSAETKVKISECARLQWSSVDARVAQAEKTRQRMAIPEARAVLSERAKQRMSSPEARRTLSERARNQMASPEVRTKLSLRMSGESNP